MIVKPIIPGAHRLFTQHLIRSCPALNLMEQGHAMPRSPLISTSGLQTLSHAPRLMIAPPTDGTVQTLMWRPTNLERMAVQDLVRTLPAPHQAWADEMCEM